MTTPSATAAAYGGHSLTRRRQTKRAALWPSKRGRYTVSTMTMPLKTKNTETPSSPARNTPAHHPRRQRLQQRRHVLAFGEEMQDHPQRRKAVQRIERAGRSLDVILQPCAATERDRTDRAAWPLGPQGRPNSCDQ
jgi:hypothetical protein